MKRLTSANDSYVLDTCRLASSGKYLPGAITYHGRKQMQAHTWKKTFSTRDAADDFVQSHFRKLGIPRTDHATLFRDSPPAWLGSR